MKTTVHNMVSTNGNRIANQFIIETPDGIFFQSYNSIICFEPKDRTQKTKLDKKYWNFSKTTGKYRNIFLGETKAETQAKINAGVYELVNLND